MPKQRAYNVQMPKASALETQIDNPDSQAESQQQSKPEWVQPRRSQLKHAKKQQKQGKVRITR